MEVNEAIARRRSIRKFAEGKEVGDADIAKIIEAGHRAPSWKNDQPWRFVVVRSQELKDRIADCLFEGNPAYKATKAASALIVLVGVPSEGEVHQGKPFWLVDCGIAGAQMYLQATELGIGTVWVSLLDSPKLCGALGLPEEMECIGMFPLGFPLPEAEAKPRTGRKPLEEVAFQEQYGRPFQAS